MMMEKSIKLHYKPVRFPRPCIDAYLRALYAFRSGGVALGGCITATKKSTNTKVIDTETAVSKLVKQATANVMRL